MFIIIFRRLSCINYFCINISVITIILKNSFFILLNGRFFLGLLTSESRVIELGMYRLSYVTFFLFMNGLLDVIVNSIRGMGLVSLPTLVTLVAVCGFRLIYVYTYFALHHTPSVLYSCFPLSWGLAMMIQIPIWVFRYRRISLNA